MFHIRGHNLVIPFIYNLITTKQITASQNTSFKSYVIQYAPDHLFLVPLEVWQKDEAHLRVRVLIHEPLTFGLLLQDVVDPL